MQTDYIPRPDADFDRFFKNILDYVMEKARKASPQEAWGHIPDIDLDNLEDNFLNIWRKAYEPTLTHPTHPETQEKNRARIVVERFLRGFVNRFLRHEPVTDFDRDQMSIPNPSGSRTPRPAPSTMPELQSDSSVARRLTWNFRDKGALNRGKPDHVHSIEIRWAILDNPPVSIDELTELFPKLG